MSENLVAGYFWNAKVFAYFYYLQFGQISSVGVPKVLKIISIYSGSFLPINKGVLLTSSAKIHPKDHISIAYVYWSFPKRTSIALYHKVTTTPVYYLDYYKHFRARPKSQILT